MATRHFAGKRSKLLVAPTYLKRALIDRIGFVTTATVYCGVGFALTMLIAIHWRGVLWPLQAQANAR